MKKSIYFQKVALINIIVFFFNLIHQIIQFLLKIGYHYLMEKI